MNSKEPTLKLDEKRLSLTVITLAWPVVLQEATWTIFAMVTMFFIGRLGASAITAVGLSETVVYLPAIIVAGLTVGVTAIVARHVGAREPEQASIIVRQSMLIAFILGVFFAIILWFLPDQLLWIFRARPDVIELGRDYIRVNAPATISVFILYNGAAILRALGDTRTPMIVMIIVEAVGVSLGYVLITGYGAAPTLGVLGAGISRARGGD